MDDVLYIGFHVHGMLHVGARSTGITRSLPISTLFNEVTNVSETLPIFL